MTIYIIMSTLQLRINVDFGETKPVFSSIVYSDKIFFEEHVLIETNL